MSFSKPKRVETLLALAVLAASGLLVLPVTRADPARPPKPGDAGEWQEASTWDDWMPYSWLAFSPDGKVVASTRPRGDKTVLRDTATGKETGSWNSTEASLIAFAPDGKLLACWENGVVEIRDPATGKSVRTLGKGNPGGQPQDLRFAPDGLTLAASSVRTFDNIPQTSDLFTWEVASGKILTHIQVRGERRANFSTYVVPLMAPDFKSYLTYGHVDGTLKVWDLATRKMRGTLPARLPVAASVLWSPDSKMVALMANLGLGTIQVWDLKTLKLKNTFRLPDGSSPGVWTWSRDSKMLAAGCKSEIRLWDCNTGEVRATLPLPKDFSSARVQFAPNGERLAAAGSPPPGKVMDGVLRMWVRGLSTAPGKER